MEQMEFAPYIHLIGTPNDSTIGIFEWELQRLIDLGKNQNKIVKIEPFLVIYDSIIKKGLVLIWNLDHDDCPFITSENICSIYEKRPLICQSYPFTSSGLKENLQNKPAVIGIGDCPNKIIPPPSMGTFQDHAKNISSVYGNIFSGAIRVDIAKEYVRSLCDQLNDNNVINRRTITPKIISKIRKHELVGLFRHAVKNNVITWQDYNYTIAQIKKTTANTLS